MRSEGVQLTCFREPEQIIQAVPGVVHRATPLCAGAFEASAITFGLGDIALQIGHCTPLLSFAAVAPGTAVVQVPLENADSLVLNGQAVRPQVVGLYGGGAELLRANPRESRYAVLNLPMDRVETLLCPKPNSPLFRPEGHGLLQAMDHHVPIGVDRVVLVDRGDHGVLDDDHRYHSARAGGASSRVTVPSIRP